MVRGGERVQIAVQFRQRVVDGRGFRTQRVTGKD